jgi:hypothetical protein
MLNMTHNQPSEAAASVPQQAQAAAVEMRPEASLQPTHETTNFAAEEYQALRAEIVARIQKQQDIMNFAILVITALLTYAGIIKLNSLALSHTVEVLGAPASLALSAFALMTLDHEMNIAHATRYLYEYLRPLWIRASGADESTALRWNLVRAQWQQPHGPLVVLPTTVAAAKYYAITGLNMLLIGAAWIEFVRHIGQFSAFSTALLIVATVLVSLTLIASAYTSRLWLTMKRATE